jgi:NDP-sugar pyrophosphorylase family protein
MGLRPVVFAVHHHASTIYDHFGSDPRWSAVRPVFTSQRGTGTDLLECLEEVPDEPFVVWNGDTIVDLDLRALLAFAEDAPGQAVVVLTRRSGVPNEGAFYVGADRSVLASREAAPPHAMPTTFAWRGSSSGVLVFRKSLLASFNSAMQLSLERDVLPSLVLNRRLCAFDNGMRYVLDFGTREGLAQLRRDEQLLRSPLPANQQPERRTDAGTLPE